MPRRLALVAFFALTVAAFLPAATPADILPPYCNQICGPPNPLSTYCTCPGTQTVLQCGHYLLGQCNVPPVIGPDEDPEPLVSTVTDSSCLSEPLSPAPSVGPEVAPDAAR